MKWNVRNGSEADVPASIKVCSYVNVNVIGNAFNILVEYKRVVDFTTGNQRYSKVATTWDATTTEMHSSSGPAFIMNELDVKLDKFLNAYLKANQK